MGHRQSETQVKSSFTTDEHGNPTGGVTTMAAPGIAPGSVSPNETAIVIYYQDGIVDEHGQNGAFVEDVIEAARQRLLFLNTNPKFRCRENSVAFTKLEEALQWLDWRTRQRDLQGVENTYETHES